MDVQNYGSGGKHCTRVHWVLALLALMWLSSASAHNKVVVIPLAGDDKLASGRVAADSPDEADYYVTPTTVVDHATVLEWERAPDTAQRTWIAAHLYCYYLITAGHADWRLPTLTELMSIIDYAAHFPSINSDAFPDTNASHYWTASSAAHNSNSVWRVNFGTGVLSTVNRVNEQYVRCVRGSGRAPDLKNNGNGTVTDWSTGLTWQREDDNISRTWQAALDYCAGLTLSGGGWRMPSAKELNSIVDITRYSPAIDEQMFPNTNAWNYWSATTYFSGSGDAWRIYFYDGYASAYLKTLTFFVRCVR